MSAPGALKGERTAIFPRPRWITVGTLYNPRLENGLERRGGRSRPALMRLASLAAVDALAGELTRGSIGTFPAITEIKNMERHQGIHWLTSQSTANLSA